MWPHVEKAVAVHRCAAAAPHGEYRSRRTVHRPPPAIDQPRRLLGEADAFVLGRLLRAARTEGRRRGWREQLGKRDAASRFAASRDEFARDFHASIIAPSRAPHRLHPRLRGPRRFRSDVDDDRHRARRRSGQPAARRRHPRVHPRMERVAGAHGRPPRRGRTTRPTSCARSARSSTSDGATAPNACSTSSSTTAARAAGNSGPRSWPRITEAPPTSATSPTSGSAPTSSAPSSTCSPTSAKRTTPSSSAPGFRRHGSIAASACADCARSTARSISPRGERETESSCNISGVRVPKGGIVLMLPGASRTRDPAFACNRSRNEIKGTVSREDAESAEMSLGALRVLRASA